MRDAQRDSNNPASETATTETKTMNDFDRKTLRKLAAKGIKLIGIQAIPDMASEMPWANASRGYTLDDNGTCRVRSFVEVLKLADA